MHSLEARSSDPKLWVLEGLSACLPRPRGVYCTLSVNQQQSEGLLKHQTSAPYQMHQPVWFS